MSVPLILAAAAAGLLSGHRAGIGLIVVGAVVIVVGVLRLFGLLPSRRTNPVVTGGLAILIGVALVVVGIVLSIVR